MGDQGRRRCGRRGKSDAKKRAGGGQGTTARHNGSGLNAPNRKRADGGGAREGQRDLDRTLGAKATTFERVTDNVRVCSVSGDAGSMRRCLCYPEKQVSP
jgi:hypothetical protein